MTPEKSPLRVARSLPFAPLFRREERETKGRQCNPLSESGVAFHPGHVFTLLRRVFKFGSPT